MEAGDALAMMDTLSNLENVTRIVTAHMCHTGYLPLTTQQLVVVESLHPIPASCIDIHDAILE